MECLICFQCRRRIAPHELASGEHVHAEPVTAATEPLEDAGLVVLEAERLLRRRLPSAVVLRFAGIYGPGRLPRAKAIRAGEPLVGDADRWLNLIHVDDAADAVLAVETRGAPGITS